MNFRNYIRRIQDHTPQELLAKIYQKSKKKLKNIIQKNKETRFPTYLNYRQVPKGEMFSYSPSIDISSLDYHLIETIRILSDKYLQHQFDLLGSGWVEVKYGMKCLGVEGHKYDMSLQLNPDNDGLWLSAKINQSNLEQSRKIWKLINGNYQPIDWQLDFKSGYRWSELIWHKDIKIGNFPGADIKVPIELGRMQHLPILAWAYALALECNQGFRKPEIYIKEFQNQVIDFIANNPPSFGVNWYYAMDVGIRIANWLITFDIFRAFGAKFDPGFIKVFKRSIYEHGRFCINNLEYLPKLRTNHYLANIAGLLFASAYLPNSDEISRWLAFSIQELISEMKFQFNQDGSNFEASTSYHRLSTEIMLYCSILIISLPEHKLKLLREYDHSKHYLLPKLKHFNIQEFDPNRKQILPKWFWERLEKAVEFTYHIRKPDGDIVQIGDNDSGRFLKLWPEMINRTITEAIKLYANLKENIFIIEDKNNSYLDENILNHDHLLNLGATLFNRPDLLIKSEENPEKKLVNELLKNCEVESYHQNSKNIKPDAEDKTVCKKFKEIGDWIEFLNENYGNPIVNRFSSRSSNLLYDYLNLYSYPDFGLYVYKSSSLYMAIRCGSIGQNGFGGHAHNDQLSIELSIDRENLITDPGSYIYTALPEKRNLFRSTFSHFTPHHRTNEQNKFYSGIKGLFHLKDQAQGECLYFKKDGFVGKHLGFGEPIYRAILINGTNIEVNDYGKDITVQKTTLFSNGYGRMVK